MADRSVSVRLSANVGGFVTGMHTAQKATEDFVGKGLDRVANRSQSISTLSTQAGVLGAGMVAGFGAATKAAVDWETAWAGVLKTVDGSETEMAALEDGLRELARTLPATHTEIAAVAEAAGQLGVEREAVLGFTETMIDLSETTNLTADEAATAIAQLGNVMGTDLTNDVDNLGAALVELGNNGASTERDIILMAQRISGAGAVIGLSEADVLGYANALSSVGIGAEAGGTAISRVFMDIASATSAGGEELTAFAEIAGMSAQEFATAFEEDPARAVATFIEGLGGISAAGGDVFGVLDELGFADIRVSQALLTMANSGDLLTDSLDMGARAWEENTALADEAAKRYETSAAQIQIAWNNIKDAAIEFGGVVLPMLADVAGAISDVAAWFGRLPDPVKNATMAIAGGGGFALLGIAAVGKLLVALAEARTALQTLGVSADVAKTKMGLLGKAMGAIGAIVVANELMELAAAASVAEVDVTALTEDLTALAEGADEVGPALADMLQKGADWSPLRTEVTTTEEAIDSFASLAREALGQDFWDRFDRAGTAGADMAKLEAAAAQLDAGFAQMVQDGNAEQASELLDQFIDAAVATNVPVEDLVALFPQFSEQIKAAGDSAENAALGQAEFAGATEQTTVTVDEQVESLGDLIDSLSTLYGVVLSQRDAERAHEAALDSLTASLTENGTTMDITTEKGRANQAALDDVAKSSWSLIDAMAENGATAGELQGKMQVLRDQFINAAVAAGYNADEANALADELGLIPANVNTHVEVSGVQTAMANVDSLVRYINGQSATIKVTTAVTGDIGGAPLVRGMSAYSGGGYTGDGGKHEVAGVVHRGEVVMSQEAVAFWGRSQLEAMNLKRGFAAGGPVGMVPQVNVSPNVSATAVLAPEDRALLQAVASRPMQAWISPRSAADLVDVGIKANARGGRS